MNEVIIRTSKICKKFNQTTIIDNLDLEIYKGDFTVIMGPSGAGKSTLLYTLSGMDKATSGSIFFGDTDITDYSSNELAAFRRENCGFVFQQMFLLDYMSIIDNIMTAGLLKKQPRKELIEHARKLLDEVNIKKEVLNKFPNQISGGEAQRCAIVRSIINNPSVIFADEPTGALNSANSEAVLNILSKLNSTGQSIIMVTHDIKSALRGDRVLFFRDGTICGECKLGKYAGDDKDRDSKLRNYLQEMNW